MSFNYSPNIPAPTDNPSDSQPLIQSNFNALNVMNSRNHVALSDVNNSGRHVVIEMEEQSADPAPTAGYGDIYVKDDGGTQNLYFQDDLSNLFRLTFDRSETTNGYLLIGGLYIQWGAESTPSTGATFPVAFPNAVFSIQVTRFNTLVGDRDASVASSNLTSFTINSVAGTDFYWIAIGN